jgi:hypothetical protein
MNALLRFQSELHRQGLGMTANQYHHMRLHGSDLLGTTALNSGSNPDDNMGTLPCGETEAGHLAVSGESIATKTKLNT